VDQFIKKCFDGWKGNTGNEAWSDVSETNLLGTDDTSQDALYPF